MLDKLIFDKKIFPLYSDKNISLGANFNQPIKSMFRQISTLKLSLATGITASALMFSSCGGGHEEESSAVADFEVTTDTMKSEVRNNLDMLRVKIPTPSKLTGQFTKAKITYNKSVLTPPGKASSYSSNYQKAIGLGALGADLGIAAAYNQSSDAVEYLGQIGKLAGDLGIGTAFDTEFCKELLQNVSKPDTFQLMLDKAFDKAEKNLRSNQRVAISILMITGGWIESMYISAEGLNTNPNAEGTKQIYADLNSHCYAFEYIFSLLEEYKANADCAKLSQELAEFKPMLASIASNTKIGAAELPTIRATATKMRSKIIG